MRKQHDQKLYTSIEDYFALSRVKATLRLKHTKCWTVTGELVEPGDPAGLFPAYTIQDLSVQPFKSIVNVAITGNIEADIAHVVCAIVNHYMSKCKMFYRVWSFDKYIESSYGSAELITIPCNGNVMAMRKSPNSNSYIPIEDQFKINSLEIEIYTGYSDKNGVPIMDNDAVIYDGVIYRITKNLTRNYGWQLVRTDDNASSLKLGDVADFVVVIGSARTEFKMLMQLANTIQF